MDSVTYARVEPAIDSRPFDGDAASCAVHSWVHWLLLGLTLITTTWAGAAHQGISLLREPDRFTEGLPYSLGLMAILGIHELGHYFTSKRHGLNVTPPYFIPAPFGLGTFGAFIRMRTPPENRKMLFDVAVAGPLAGLAVAIPALIVGLKSSVIVPGATVNGTLPTSSIMMDVAARVVFGNAYQGGDVIRLSPLGFAGWLGLLVTALNLMPIGQLDGGHIARAMFGNNIGGKISKVAVGTLFALALFVWPGLLMWAFLVYFLARPMVPPLHDLTPINTGRKLLGVVAFLILLAILIPMPEAFLSAGIRCPYL